MSDLIRSLASVREADSALVGPKAANLGSLLAAGFPVPPGLCLTTEAFKAALGPFRDQIAAALKQRDLADPRQAGAAATAIDRTLAGLELPDPIVAALHSRLPDVAVPGQPVAVRSSATAEDLPGASFAGQYDTVLGARDEAEIVAAVLACWRSFYSANALAARAEQGLGAQEAMAVLVQRVVAADCAGVAFSVDPVAMRRDTVVISACWGMGAGVVDGSVATDTHWITRATLKPDRRQIVEKSDALIVADGGLERRPVDADRRRSACLPDEWAGRVAGAAVLAERLFGSPQDVEWAIAGGKLWVLQSRPLTGLADETRALDPFPVEWEPAGDGLKAWSLWWEDRDRIPLPLEGDYGDLFLGGWREAARFRGSSMFGESDRRINGRRFIVTAPAELQPGDMRVRREAYDQFHDRMLQVHGLTTWDLWGPEVIARTRALHEFDRGNASDDALAGHLEDALGAMYRHWVVHGMIFGGVDRYLAACRALVGGGRDDVWSLAFWLAEGAESPTTALLDRLYALALEARNVPPLADVIRGRPPDAIERIRALPEAATFCRLFDAVLDEYGERSGAGRGSKVGFLTPTWREAPEPVLALIEPYLDPGIPAPAEARRESERERDAQVEELCSACPDPETVAEFRRQLAHARRMLLLEEAHNHYIDQMSLGQLRLATIEAARRLTARGDIETPDDVWWLRRDELPGLLRSASRDVRPTVVRRKELHSRWEALVPPPVLGAPDSVLPPRPDWKDEVAVAPEVPGVVRGQGGSRGRRSGRAQVIAMETTVPDLQPGDVLVAVNAGPAWTPFFPILAGVVLDEGAYGEHSAAIAREYGVPLVFGTGNATRRISDGARVTVDGSDGTVEIAEAVATDQPGKSRG